MLNFKYLTYSQLVVVFNMLKNRSLHSIFFFRRLGISKKIRSETYCEKIFLKKRTHINIGKTIKKGFNFNKKVKPCDFKLTHFDE